MATLSRATSLESNGSDPKMETLGASSAEAKDPGSPMEQQTSSKSSPPSHTLLSTSPSHTRKGRFADPSAPTCGNISRASLSMPPPATKPASRVRPGIASVPSASLDVDGAQDEAGESAAVDELHKTSSVASQTSAPETVSCSSAHHDSPLMRLHK